MKGVHSPTLIDSVFCRSGKKLFIQKAISLLAFANETVDEGCTSNMDTDSEECVNIISAVTACVGHTVVQHSPRISITKELVSGKSLDTELHVAITASDETNINVIVRSNPDVYAATGKNECHRNVEEKDGRPKLTLAWFQSP